RSALSKLNRTVCSSFQLSTTSAGDGSMTSPRLRLVDRDLPLQLFAGAIEELLDHGLTLFRAEGEERAALGFAELDVGKHGQPLCAQRMGPVPVVPPPPPGVVIPTPPPPPPPEPPPPVPVPPAEPPPPPPPAPPPPVPVPPPPPPVVVPQHEPRLSPCARCAGTAALPTQMVCSFAGLPGGM